jgi:hypothetical protein
MHTREYCPSMQRWTHKTNMTSSSSYTHSAAGRRNRHGTTGLAGDALKS